MVYVMLTREEEAMLNGEMGEGVRRAMEIIVALGKIYNASGLVKIESAHISGVSYKNLGDEGLEFLEEFASMGVKTMVEATLNPAGMDMELWEELGFSREFAEKQIRIVKAYEKMGVKTTCTCTPYLVENKPKFGQHIAWGESSAIIYANSILGARTNRESGISALASAITGRTAKYGLHLDENRLADYVIKVKCNVKGISDFGALGYLIGKRVGNKVPYITGIETADLDELKSLGASMAASGAVGLFHMENITPEAKIKKIVKDGAEEIEIEDLREAYEALNYDAREIDVVSIGCPHASIDEIGKVANMIKGRKINSQLWITTSRKVYDEAKRRGLLDIINEAGGKVIRDTCMVVAPIEELGFKTLATNSAKMATLAPLHSKVKVRFGSLEDCIKAAISGVWNDN
jgi:predicted aconitase